jgi:hypothetical protein
MTLLTALWIVLKYALFAGLFLAFLYNLLIVGLVILSLFVEPK